MKRSEFIKATGASERQVDLWYTWGMDLCDHHEYEGQGRHRNYKRESVPAVRLIVDIQKTLGRGMGKSILTQIFNDYKLGYTVLVNGLLLKWRVEDVRTDASPEGGA